MLTIKNITTFDKELQKFLMYKNQFSTNSEFTVEDIDSFGFTVQSSDQKQSDAIDFLICGLTHGNEVIGLQMINLILETLFNCNMTIPIKLGFILNSIEAAKVNKRFISKDLNRCFHDSASENNEKERATFLKSIIKKSNFILDLHQTIEKCEMPFFIIPPIDNLIKIATNFDSETPIVTFPQEGFSKDGMTLIEYAATQKKPALVIEIGQIGFDEDLANEYTNIIVDHIFKFKEIFSQQPDSVYFLQIKELLTKEHGEFVTEFANMQKITSGQQICSHYQAKFDGVILFPKYGEKYNESFEKGYIAELIKK